jgi:hypothetical protein
MRSNLSSFNDLGTFGKGKGYYAPPPPKPPPEDIVPTITPEEEMAILEATLPIPEPEPSFIRRNAIPLFVGGGVLVLGMLGMVLLIKI